MKIVPSRELPKQYHSGASAKAAPSASAAHSAKTAVSHLPLPEVRSPAALLKSLGLPADRLSGSIVSFARFFSLPLEPDFLAKVRRQVKLPEKALPAALGAAPEKAAEELPAGAGFFRNREALSLAATAAADKGTELNWKSLEDYASAIDPDRQDGKNSGGGENSGGRGNQGASGQNAGGKNDGRRKDGNGEIEPALAIASPALREKLLEYAGNNPVLNLLNRLPGKNGQRWIVLPLSFVEQGLLYRVSLRILLDAGGAAGHFILETAAGPAGAAPERRWSFAMDREKRNKPRLRVSLWPPASPKTLQSLAGELAALMGLPPESVFVENYAEFFPFAENSGYNVLRTINEEV
ncbi:MAG: hypothetical protein LBG57_07795 [Treponema sp.]|jgi:hypothetical protein|nr:hypothetical protein [Treponema sp.]